MTIIHPKTYRELYTPHLVFVAVILLMPLILRGRLGYLINLLTLTGIYAIIVAGLTLLMGFTGQISLGHAAFYGLGAYTSAILSVHAGFPLYLSIPLAIAFTGALAYLIGRPILKLHELYLALATLCVGVGFYEIISKSERLRPFTGGAAGMYDLPSIGIFGIVPRYPIMRFYLIWLIVALIAVWFTNLFESDVGRALRAISTDEEAAETCGINVAAYKVKIFVISAMLGALGGGLYAHLYTPAYLGPEEFYLMFSLKLVLMAVLGGLGSVWGGIAGAVLLSLLHELLSLAGEALGLVHSSMIEQAIFGSILVGIMIFSPRGLVPGLRGLLIKILRRKQII